MTASPRHRERPRRLVLVGGGHAHLGVLELLARERPADLDVTLISSGDRSLYSGMVPGWLGGDYGLEELTFHLPRLCHAAGVTFVATPADEIRVAGKGSPPEGSDADPSSLPTGDEAGVVRTGEGRHPFDLASVDIGSVPRGRHLPGVREHAFSLRPIERARTLVEALQTVTRRTDAATPVRAVVVGGGAAGFEVALAVERRIGVEGGRAAVTLVEAGPRILPEMSERVRRRAEAILARRGIALRTGVEVKRVDSGGVEIDGGQRIPAERVLWATGAAPSPLLGHSNLPLGEGGYFHVDDTLRSVDGAPVWGAGDCIDLAGHPEMPKAGVYAVRQAPILARNLLHAATRGVSVGPEALERYSPQPSFLSLMNTADGKALLRWKGLVAHTRWARWLKDWIDRRFMARYRSLASSDRERTG